MVIFMNNKPMLNAYPDSMGGRLSDIVSLLLREELQGTFGSFYILPSLYHSDLDRGFCVIDYDINEELASPEDLRALKEMGIDLKLDFIMNHASARSPQFRELVDRGEKSEYQDFFINWNDFWQGYGQMTEDGYIQPEQKYIEKMFFRKPGLPILMVQFPDGKKVPYWNTFYQEEHYPVYLGQMDLNIKSPKVWDFYRDTLKKIAAYGADIVRLDAFAYAPKEPGEKNFLNEPGTWELLSRIRELADFHKLSLLPEIHATYEEKIYQKISEKGYMTYDFFLPGLVIDAIEKKRSGYLAAWAKEIVENDIRVVNMLGCHDGIPLLDLKGILPEQDIQNLIDLIVERGGLIKNLHGQKNMYYQVNATYFSALGESEQKLLMARAIQLFMPGKPQIWYLDLLAGKNDYEAVQRVGDSGHKEINRTNLTLEEVDSALKKEIVKKQIEMIRFRNTCSAFDEGAKIRIEEDEGVLRITWTKDTCSACLTADFIHGTYEIKEIAI